METNKILYCNINMFELATIGTITVNSDSKPEVNPISVNIDVDKVPELISLMANNYKINTIQLFGDSVNYCNKIKTKILNYNLENYSNNTLRIEVIKE